MTLHRRGRREPPQPPPGPDPADEPHALLGEVFELNRFVNANAGRLPGEAVVIARRITDTVREILDGAAQHPLDVHTTVAIRGLVGDYLPTTLRTFLAVDADVVDVPRPSGVTPAQSVLEQLETLLLSAADLRASARADEADALLSQGSFLRTKFTRSDLDL
jgi:hypothetical protein